VKWNEIKHQTLTTQSLSFIETAVIDFIWHKSILFGAYKVAD
jgi:hypothetical protein